MVIEAEVTSINHTRYQLVTSADGSWRFRRRIKGGRIESFPLDLDRRHQRLFLSERDQNKVGIDGIVMLEYLTRRVLDR